MEPETAHLARKVLLDRKEYKGLSAPMVRKEYRDLLVPKGPLVRKALKVRLVHKAP